ncbi:MAG TPA: DMT family transporter [Bacillota bacterium]|nr:DMT family transporter [Bacillota bacterium]
MNKKIKSTIFLLLCAILWGVAFVAQRDGMADMGPFYFSAFRMYMGSLTLIPIIYLGDRLKKHEQGKSGMPEQTSVQKAAEKGYLIRGGVLCGTVIFFAANFQQVGLVSVSAGKTAFITTLYIILVPLFGMFMKHRPNIFNWTGVILGTVGLYFLCITESLSIAFGDLIILIGAFFWAAHILCIGFFAPKVDVAKLTCIQFLIAGTISLAVAIFREPISAEIFVGQLPNLFFAGVLSCGLAFTFQALGQKDANPTVASIILSTEALFGALGGFIFLGESFTQRELIGCILMFAAIIIAQLPSRKEKSQ